MKYKAFQRVAHVDKGGGTPERGGVTMLCCAVRSAKKSIRTTHICAASLQGDCGDVARRHTLHGIVVVG